MSTVASHPTETMTMTAALKRIWTSAMTSKRVRRRLGNTILYVLLLGGSITFLYPLAWAFATSLKPLPQLSYDPLGLIPRPAPVWSNYIEALTVQPFVRYTLNTLFIVVLNIIGTVGSGALVAYGFARFRFLGRDLLFTILLATMMLPGQVTMIPIYVLFAKIGWVDTYKPLIIPNFFGGGAFTIFLLRQFFMTLPLDLDDAARIDGANFLQILLHVIAPLAKPALMTIAIFTFLGVWNDFFGPLIYLNSKEKATIALGVYYFRIALFQFVSVIKWNLLMAASLVFMIPSLVIFFLAQKQFTEGITLTGVRG